MVSITKTRVTNQGRYTPTVVAQIVKGDLLAGYKKIIVEAKENDEFKIIKYPSEVK